MLFFVPVTMSIIKHGWFLWERFLLNLRIRVGGEAKLIWQHSCLPWVCRSRQGCGSGALFSHVCGSGSDFCVECGFGSGSCYSFKLCKSTAAGLQNLHCSIFEPPRLHCEHPPSSLAPFEPLKLLNFGFNPDPAFHCSAGPDLASQNNADPAPDPGFESQRGN